MMQTSDLPPGYKLFAGGFEVDVESVAYETNDTQTHLWFLSAVGTQQSCRTIAAKMLKPNPDVAQLGPNSPEAVDDFPWHSHVVRSPDCKSKWTFTVKRLSLIHI